MALHRRVRDDMYKDHVETLSGFHHLSKERKQIDLIPV